jgi:ketosteroid isomerase-like protein
MTNTTDTHAPRAAEPEDLARLFVQLANARDADGMAELYEPDAVLAFPPGSATVGRDAIRAVLRQLVEHAPRFELEPPLPTVRNGDLALTSTRPADGTGGRVQLVRRQPDGSWLRVIDRPEIRD